MTRAKPKLRKHCTEELSLLSNLGNRLPGLVIFRKRVIRWFPYSVVYLCDILWVFILERRRATAEYYATGFLILVEQCLDELIDAGVQRLTLTDPLARPGHDVVYEREDLRELRKRVREERALERKGMYVV